MQTIPNIQPLVGRILLFGEKASRLIVKCRDFYKLEKEVQRQSLEMALEIFAWVLQEIDAHLMDARDKRTWEVVGFRERTLVTSFGELGGFTGISKREKPGFFLTRRRGSSRGGADARRV
ncbi:UPF0236 family transposase-like protein [Ammonifex degensii]|uniref:UPF0236 family transposase-like protein n=1 Tax=Ammonifex degensii TaxID=42838 RepID=UPI000A03CE28|nr:UPF0236 family protein [Ammonifex degensii]